MEKLDLKEQLKEIINVLKDKKSNKTELISLYIPPDRKKEDVINYLAIEIQESINIKSRATRKNIIQSLCKFIKSLTIIDKIPEKNGLAIFSGLIYHFFVDVPKPIKTFRYHIASEFLLWPLEEMLTTKE